MKIVMLMIIRTTGVSYRTSFKISTSGGVTMKKRKKSD
jgi:hypothetical protein